MPHETKYITVTSLGKVIVISGRPANIDNRSIPGSYVIAASATIRIPVLEIEGNSRLIHQIEAHLLAHDVVVRDSLGNILASIEDAFAGGPPPHYSDATRPVPPLTYPVGFEIFNTDDNAPNYVGTDGFWHDADGVIT
jgi:hypothetical protein